MLGPKDFPFAVTGERTLILEKPPKGRTEGGLYIPDNAKERYYSGILLDAGLQALDKLYDHGYELGDTVEFGRYAGLREAWDHVVEGDHTLPADAYEWRIDNEMGNDSVKYYRCQKTGALRAIESVIVLNCDDLIASVELAERLRRGEMAVRRAPTTDGKIQHVIERV